MTQNFETKINVYRYVCSTKDQFLLTNKVNSSLFFFKLDSSAFYNIIDKLKGSALWVKEEEASRGAREQTNSETDSL